MNLPNFLSLTRILIVPVLVVVLMTKVTNHEVIGVVVFWVASITDWLDGYLARRWKQVTTLGKLLDPLADKLLVAGALISLVDLNLAPAWMTFIILAREFAVTGLRGIASEEGLTIPAGTVGKWKMGFQVAAISCLILGPRLDYWLYDWTHREIFHFFIQLNRPYSFFWGMGVLLLWGAVILAIWSAIAYFHGFWKIVGPRIMAENSRLMDTEESE
jgi:CDP-diacylglycerol--glycerol-3-phosphate 3-phosphatidyltransferase